MSAHLRTVAAPRRALVALVAAAGLLAAGRAAAQQQLSNNLPAPRLMTLTPPGGKVGSSVEVTFTGTDLEEPEQLLFSHPGLKAEPVAAAPPPKPDPKAKPPKPPKPGMGQPTATRFKVTLAADVPPGIYDVRLVNKWGVSNPRAFVAGDLAEVLEKEPNNDVAQAQRVEINSTVNGAMASPVDVDYYVFAGKKGQRVVFSCLASSIDSRFHAGLEVYGANDRLLASGRDYHGGDALADCTLPDDGEYLVRVFQFTHTQGTAEHFYRLSITTAPWIDAVFPCVVEPGKTTAVTLYGRNLPGGKPDPAALSGGRVLEKITVNVTAPAEPAPFAAFAGLAEPKSAGVDGFPYRLRNEAGWSNPVWVGLAQAPVVLDNGNNDTPQTAQEITLPCEIAGHVEKPRDRDWYAFTAKKGDVYTVEVLSDRLGAPAYPYFMLRSDKADLKESDDNPDMVSRKFYARTEDPQAYRFTVPADGKYWLLVSDRLADTVAGPRHFYRVRVTPPKPDFRLVALAAGEFRPAGTTVRAGTGEAFTVFALRQDGFVGDIALSAEGLPAGVTAAPQTVGGALRETRFVVSAAPGAAPWTGEVKIVGTATVNGKKVVRTAQPASIVWPVQPNQNIPTISRLDRGLVLAVRPGAPYSVSASLDKPALVQGEKGTLKVKLTRLSSDFKTPLTVQAIQTELPQGLTLNNNQPVTIAANQAEGSLAVNVQPNVPPGTYNLVLRTQAQMPYSKDPAAKQKPNTSVALPSAPVTLTVLPKSLANLSLSTGGVTVKLGQSAEVVVRVARQNGYDGEFKVQVVLPQGAKGVQIADAVVAAAQSKKKPLEPIRVVELKRAEAVLYDKDVEPILLNKCAVCHSDNIKEGKLDLGSYEALMKGGKRGAAVVPGKSADSLLVKLAGRTQRPGMPPRGEEPLTPEELALIKLWVDQGAKAPATRRERPKVIVGAPPANVHPVLGVAVSPDKAHVAASRGNQVHVYEAASGKHVRALIDPQLTAPDRKPIKAAHLSLVEALAYSPDGKTLASGAFQEVILWDAQTGALRRRLTGFADRVVALEFSHDGKLLATGGGAPTADGEIKVFNAADGKLVVDIKGGHSDTVFGVSFSPDDKKLATCAADKFVKVFEVPGGKFLKSFEGHTHHVLGVGWKADGKLLASAGADNVIKIWDFDKGEQVRTIPGHGKQVTRLVFVGKTDQFATCSGDQTVRFWNVNGGNTRNFSGSADFLYALGVSPDGALVVAGGQEGVTRVYNGTNGQLVKSLVPPGEEPAAPKKK